ncbi:hypothetical protein SAMN05444277_101673 [Parafilimonas terrae]|uniref:Outer membrane protein beta-barrel domain-containing protein n=2 Tax=Parafilimonas terrae TaxID=1465490 RepID=A0A1I5SAS8_9BACT|nr:hypothetical protein SAMN05444277_101673 [Parafilimonas terrae]
MQENEFEKQVKNLMEGFKPAPSDEAWAKISRRLKEKRRRRLPFIFLLATGLAAAGLLFYYTGNKQDTVQNTVAINNSNAGIAQDGAVLNDSGVASINNKVEKNNADNSKSSLPTDKGRVNFISKKMNEVAGINKSIKKNNTGISAGITKDNSLDGKDQPGDVITNAKGNDDKAGALQKDLEQATSEEIQAVNQNPVNKPDNNIAKNDSNNNTHDNIQIAKPALQSNKLPKWQWGVNAFYGANSTVKSIGSIGKPDRQSALSAPTLTAPTAIISGDTVFNKYAYTSSSAYSFGFEVQRSISKNSSINAGLNFTHLATASNVRGVVNANYAISPDYMVNNYYRPGVVKEYINKYNFIELPVSFQQNLLQRKMFAFGYNAGFSVRQLLNSNSLIYNEQGNIYFSNDDLLRKTQLQLQAGLNLKFNTGKTTSVYAGPQISYSLSNFTKNKDNGNFHFMTYGLKAGLLFHKK